RCTSAVDCSMSANSSVMVPAGSSAMTSRNDHRLAMLVPRGGSYPSTSCVPVASARRGQRALLVQRCEELLVCLEAFPLAGLDLLCRAPDPLLPGTRPE